MINRLKNDYMLAQRILQMLVLTNVVSCGLLLIIVSKVSN